MNFASRQEQSSPEEQAALWAAILDGGELSSESRARLDAWLAENPRHRVLLSEYCQFSADLEEQLPMLVATGAVPMPEPRSQRTFRVPRSLWLAGALGAAAAAVVLAFRIDRPESQSDTVATSVAQRKAVNLGDGSVVELNARTSMLVALNATERRVRLADGQAFFTVAKDASRPFVVETPAGTIRVTGTVFDVHTDTAADLRVTVVHGSVQVTPTQTDAGRSGAPVALGAGDQLVADATRVSVRSLERDEVNDALAWRRGEVVFAGTPLSAALAQFARHHGRTITSAPEIAKLGVGGRFSLDDLDGFLNALEAFLPVQVSRASSGAIAVTPRTGG